MEPGRKPRLGQGLGLGRGCVLMPPPVCVQAPGPMLMLVLGPGTHPVLGQCQGLGPALEPRPGLQLGLVHGQGRRLVAEPLPRTLVPLVCPLLP